MLHRLAVGQPLFAMLFMSKQHVDKQAVQGSDGRGGESKNKKGQREAIADPVTSVRNDWAEGTAESVIYLILIAAGGYFTAKLFS